MRFFVEVGLDSSVARLHEHTKSRLREEKVDAAEGRENAAKGARCRMKGSNRSGIVSAKSVRMSGKVMRVQFFF